MIKLSFLFLLLLGLISCQDYNSSTLDEVRFGPGPDESGDVNFGAARKVILDKCLSCHSSWGPYTNEEWISSGLIIRGDPDNSLLITRIINAGGDPNTANMPLGMGPLPPAEFTALKTWITNIP